MERIKKNSYLYDERVDDLSCPEPTLAQQHMANECDINQIVDRAIKTGVLGDPIGINRRAAVFGDFSEVGDFKACVDRVQAASLAFMELPPDIRARFNNDPGSLIAFLQDASNFDEAVKLGLLVKKEPAAAVAAGDKPAASTAGASTTPGASGSQAA